MSHIPPNDIDSERALLRSVMCKQEAYDWASEIVRAEHFYSPGHQVIWSVMSLLRERGKPIDIVSVGSHLKSSGQMDKAGGQEYVRDLVAADAIGGSDSVIHCAQLIADKFTMRRLIETCHDIEANAYRGASDVKALVDESEQRLYNLNTRAYLSTEKNFGTLLAEAPDKLKSICERGTTITGIPTGLTRYDTFMSGLHRGELTIMAARPGMGKSALLMNVAVNIASSGFATVIFSLEMLRDQLTMRSLCSDASIDL